MQNNVSFGSYFYFSNYWLEQVSFSLQVLFHVCLGFFSSNLFVPILLSFLYLLGVSYFSAF